MEIGAPIPTFCEEGKIFFSSMLQNSIIYIACTIVQINFDLTIFIYEMQQRTHRRMQDLLGGGGGQLFLAN